MTILEQPRSTTENDQATLALESLNRWLEKIKNCDSDTKQMATWCLFKGQLRNFESSGLIGREDSQALEDQAQTYLRKHKD